MKPTRARGRVLLAGLLLPILASGCDDDAVKFATQTAALLQQRSDEIASKMAAETRAYNNVAAAAAVAHRDLVDLSLRNERNSRSLALAADYDEGRKPVSRWQTDIAEYGKIDYTITRELLTADLDAGSLFLQKLQALKVEQDKVDALATLLKALAEKPTLTQDLAALGSFGQSTKAEFDKRVCAELAKDTSAAGKAALAAKGCK